MLFCCEAKTQTNLVYNGDFEIYSSCPNTISTPGNVEMTKCNGWTNPTEATPDYFNICNNSTTGIVGIPYNSVGFQQSHSGNGYMGIIMFEYDSISYWYEYIQGKLTYPLVKDKYYNFSFYVSLADGYSDIAIKNIGVYLSTYSFTTLGTQKLNLTPQIVFSSLVVDTLKWTKLNGIYKALGGESYLTIGYFGNIITDSIRINTLPPSGVSSYYYIDALELSLAQDSITKCDLNLPNIFTPNQDNINDKLIISNCSTIIQTTIYNRWGNKVFETSNLNYYWDGRTTAGEECVDGTYYYIIETEEEKIKGFVQLIR